MKTLIAAVFAVAVLAACGPQSPDTKAIRAEARAFLQECAKTPNTPDCIAVRQNGG